VLATGVVLVGGHLTHLLSSSSATQSPALVKHNGGGTQLRLVPSTTVVSSLVSTTTTTLLSDSELTALAARVARSMLIVRDGDASGVGVVINSNGYVLVPASLVTDTGDISVVLNDDQQPVATLVGIDYGTGLAVVRVDDSDALTSARFVSETVGNGSFVALVWQGQTGTQACWGAVNALDVPLAAVKGSPSLLESLRTLDPRPVTAGGVLIDGDGRLIGMVTSVKGRTLVATPGWLIAIVSRDLILTGHVIHGWLGITGATVWLSTRVSRVEVLKVDPGGAAAKAGVEPGDLIEAVNGEPIRNMSDIFAALYPLPPNRAIVLRFARGGHMWAARTWLKPAA